MLLRRAAAFAVLMLAAQTALWAITVTLKPGRGEGSDIVIDSSVEEHMAANQSSAANGQFWTEGDKLWFKFPDCPASFTAPEGEILLGWYVGDESSSPLNPGTQNTITESLVLIAYWGVEEFEERYEGYNITYAVTSKSPKEVKVKSIHVEDRNEITIPATVEHDWEEYTVVEIGDGVLQDNSALNTLTFAEGAQLRAMGENAFKGCNNLHTIHNIPGSIESKGGYLFDGANELQEVTIWGNRRISEEYWVYIMNAQSVTVTMPANSFGDDYWTTFYNPNSNFQADGNTTVYKATLSGDALLLHEVEDRIIDTWAPVILKSTGNPVLTKTETRSSDTAPNDLQGSDNDGETFPGTYVLYGGAQGLGFYPFSGTTLQCGKAYIIISQGGSVRGYVGMNEVPSVGTVGIQLHAETRQAEQEAAEAWTALDGRRLPVRPTRPGIYLRGGRKVVIK